MLDKVGDLTFLREKHWHVERARACQHRRRSLSETFCLLVILKVQAGAKCLRALKLMGFKNDDRKVKWVTWVAQFWDSLLCPI